MALEYYRSEMRLGDSSVDMLDTLTQAFFRHNRKMGWSCRAVACIWTYESLELLRA